MSKMCWGACSKTKKTAFPDTSLCQYTDCSLFDRSQESDVLQTNLSPRSCPQVYLKQTARTTCMWTGWKLWKLTWQSPVLHRLWACGPWNDGSFACWNPWRHSTRSRNKLRIASILHLTSSWLGPAPFKKRAFLGAAPCHSMYKWSFESPPLRTILKTTFYSSLP